MTLQEKNDNVELIANAIQRGEESIVFNASGTQHHVNLPTPQRAGTMTQQRCYAVDKARELVEECKRIDTKIRPSSYHHLRGPFDFEIIDDND